MGTHKLNKAGKWLLLISSLAFVGFFCWLFVTAGNIQPEYLGLTLLLGAVSGMTLSVSLIYFHSIPRKRKRTIVIVSSIAGTLLLFGIVSKFFHWIGAGIETVLAVFLFSGAALPLIIKNRYEKRKGIVSAKTLVLNILDLTSILLIAFGLLSRIMHWPGSAIMLILGISLLVITFIFWNILFRKEVRLRFQAEEKLRLTLKQVEDKNKEITDSINYAKRLQEAIFPSMQFIANHIPDNFILYRPKDILAGDFYWAEEVDGVLLLAVADCTGHGVPGALVSVVCCNALNRSVKEFKLSDPGKILDKTNELVVESFSKKGEQIKDGMDVSIVRIDGNQIQWAGANNPLWYVRKKEDNMHLFEIKGDRQGIGYSENPRLFQTHLLTMEKGDMVYLFTDGFADQFGGVNGKKFKYKPFQELLKANCQTNVLQQERIIETTFLDWKGNLEQVDDLCVLGFRIGGE